MTGGTLDGAALLTGGQFLSGRLARFSVAGSIGFVVQVAALWLLVSLTGIHYVLATAIAVELAILVNFVWHERWTFQDRV